MGELLRVMIADTIGKWRLHENYVAAFPNATFVQHGEEMSEEPHPHGGLVASRLLLPLIDEQVEVHFVPVLADQATRDPLTYMLEKIEEIEPHFVNCSFGMDRPANAVIDRAWAEVLQPWVDEEHTLRQRLGYFIALAAGNTNTRGLAYHDVGYPTRLMKDAVVVGAIDRHGCVMPWSADGNLTGCALGHRVRVLNPFLGIWELGSGTSFGCPDFLAVVAVLVLSGTVRCYHDVVKYMLENVEPPDGFTRADLPHPMFGNGQFADLYEAQVQEHRAHERTGMQSLHPLSSEPLDWFEFIDLRRP